MSSEFDAILIGAGQAAPALAVRLAGSGWRVAVIERSHLGGSCVNFGCTPTKAMVACARRAWLVRHAGELGVQIGGEVHVDMERISARTAALVERSRQGLRDWLKSTDGVTLIEGHARLAGAGRVRVGDRELHSDTLLINTGTRSMVPDIPGLADSPFWTPGRITRTDSLPEHLLVLGGGYIGVEFAQMFRRFGSRVSVIERHARLLEQEDTDVSAAIQEALEAEGIELLLATQASALRRANGGIEVEVEGAGQRRAVQGSHLLLALGRVPNSDDLGLETAGVETDARGYIEVDRRLRTCVPGIWALGDVNGKGAFTHTAYHDHEIVADALLGDGRRSLDERIEAHAVFVDPPFARIGATEAQLRRAGQRVLRAKLPMKRVARARERGETRGFMKVMVDAERDRVLGAAIFGIAGDEVIHSILNLMYADAPWQVLRDGVGIHPTVSELLPTLMEGLEPLPEPAVTAQGAGGSG